jgi:hypothetical protein
MEDDKGRRRWQLERTGEFPGQDGPVIEPIDVGSMLGQDYEGVSREPWVMTVTIDPDAVPKLREALERHMSGTVLDVTTQWHTAFANDVSISPLAFLRIEIPGFEVVFHIVFDVDEYKRSLGVAARTGLVLLLEPTMSQALRLRPPEQALREHISMGMTVSDVEPLRRVLSQRFDFPLTEREVPREIHTAEEAGDALRTFVQRAVESPSVTMNVTPGAPPIVAVTDRDAARALAGVEGKRWAHWSSVMIGPHSVARLDLLQGRTILWSWVWANPPEELVRLAASGFHLIAVLAEDLPHSPQAAHTQVIDAVHFPVEEAAEAMRALIPPSTFEDPDNP